MARLFQSMRGLVAALLFVVGTVASGAQDIAPQAMTLLPDTDLPGFDYAVVKDTDLDACEAACAEDRICRAFTFNEKAGWCFLKSEIGEATVFDGATSGTTGNHEETLGATREGELPFPAGDLAYYARTFATDLRNTDPVPEGAVYADLIASGDDAVAAKNQPAAILAYRQALAINNNDPALWLKLAAVVLVSLEAEPSNAYDLGVLAVNAAMNAYLLAETRDERVNAMSALAYGLERREMWRESIATYRAVLELKDDAELQARLDQLVAEHGFRIVSDEVDAEAATPRICAVFSDPLPNADLSQYVVVQGAPQVAVETEQNQICVTGVAYGQRYTVEFRAGLPSQDGETLRNTVSITQFVPDRAPFVGFASNAYVLPAGLGSGLPITSVNAETADVVIYRVGDRSIATAVRNGLFQRTLDGYSADDVANTYGEQVWEGQVDLVETERNALSTTAIPVGEVLTDLQPGAYVITAKVANSNQEYWNELATQWFIVTDLGATTVEGDDGVHAFVRSLSTAQPVEGATVRLIAVNNEILGEATTDADGRATFAPGLARGTGGRAPQIITVETANNDYAFLDVAKSAFDLTDRGVEGRPSPGPLDLFATTERGIYRPGEIVFLTALLRDVKAEAVTGLPLTLELERPDGVVAFTTLLDDAGQGSYFEPYTLNPDAMRGSWTARFYADPKAAALQSLTFLVEDFEPERLAFDVSAADAPIPTGAPTEIDVAAKYLYGATAPDLRIEADAVLRPTSSVAGYAGYTFGRHDDPFETYYMPLGQVGVTDEAGNAVAELNIPDPGATTRPLVADLYVRLVDSNGRPVQRTLSRPVLAQVDRIGLKPQFSEYDGLQEGAQAGFDIIVVNPDGETVDKAGLDWRMSRIETNYQWYRQNGVWKWEAVTTTREIANGTVDATATGPVTVSAPVQWGSYLLEVDNGETASSYRFYAGYYYPEAGSDTPDTLQVALDKEAYRPGETANLKLDPQFAGTALILVVDNRIIHMESVEVPEGGITVPLTVTDEWGPGAYVTAILYRPSSEAEKRMPARALGLAFADVDPGDRQLDVKLTAPSVALPRQTFTVDVELGNAAAGQEAYVAVMAVDLGILNLTSFQVPDPDGWYFGQRQLGVEFRDLYGQLIDPMQGAPGTLRSGGDGAPARLTTPPPTSVLVAQHSGIVKVDANGKATVTFDMPDFAGTVRIMAMAWSKAAVGHASTDVIVRDPVVVTMSPPRFLRLDDESRLLVEINNVSGEAGDYKVELLLGDGLATDTTEQTVTLATGERIALNLPLRATAIGDNDLRLLISGPGGMSLVKELTLGVRAASGPQTTSTLIPLPAGETVTLDASYFEGIVPHSGSLTAAIGPFARLDVPGLLLKLDRYPYGCAEQVTSRALPLLYLNEVAEMLELGTDEELTLRIDDAIADLLSKQSSNGGFGLWGPYSGTDMWLDSYVTDFLLRARAEGHAVPELALNRALDSLANQVSYASDFTEGGEDIAYALLDLARAGRAAIGDLRYYLEARLDNFGSPLAKAQLGAALAIYGDRTRASEAFAAAVEGLRVREDRYRWRADYGSQLRDTAGVLALAAEFTPAGIDLAALTRQLADLTERERWTSTQEDAWTLVAASALAREAGDGSITINEEELTGTVYRRYWQEYFTDEQGSVTITNNGNTPTEVRVSVSGIPTAPPPATEMGFSLWRDVYTPDGTLVEDLSQVTQNDRFVVVLSLKAHQLGSGQYVVADPLPAGFEIENPNLANMAGVGDFSWLSISYPAHVESRTDQYIAAFRYSSDAGTLSTAYVVRAVTPGTFVLPGATVEDMYRPEFRANTAAGTIAILPAGTPVVQGGGAEIDPAAEPATEGDRAEAEPDDKAAETFNAGVIGDAGAANTVGGLDNRKVKTVLVKPDGTIVP